MSYLPPETPFDPATCEDIAQSSRIMMFRIPAFAMIRNPTNIHAAFNMTDPTTHCQVSAIACVFDLMTHYIAAVGNKKDSSGRPALVVWWEFVPKGHDVQPIPRFRQAEEYRLWIATSDFTHEFLPQSIIEHIITMQGPEVERRRIAAQSIKAAKSKGHVVTVDKQLSIFYHDLVGSIEDLENQLRIGFNCNPKCPNDRDPLNFLNPRNSIVASTNIPPLMADYRSYLIGPSYRRGGGGGGAGLGAGAGGGPRFTCPHSQYCYRVQPATLFPVNILSTIFPWKDKDDVYLRTSAEMYCAATGRKKSDSPFSFLPKADTREQDDINCRALRKLIMDVYHERKENDMQGLRRDTAEMVEMREVCSGTSYAAGLVDFSAAARGRGAGDEDGDPEDSIFASAMAEELDLGSFSGRGSGSGRRRTGRTIEVDGPVHLGEEEDRERVGTAVAKINRLGNFVVEPAMLYPKAHKMMEDHTDSDSPHIRGMIGEYNPNDPFFHMMIMNQAEDRRMLSDWSSREEDLLTQMIARWKASGHREDMSAERIAFLGKFSRAYALHKYEMLEHFMSVWHPAGNHVSKATHGVIRATHEQIAKHGSLSDPTVSSITSNLTDAGETVLRWYNYFDETLYAVSSHQWMWLIFMFALSAFDPIRRQMTHAIMFGPAMAGKSFIMGFIMTCMAFIAASVTRKTKAADTTSENTDGEVTCMDEMQSSYFGLGDGTKHGASASSDAESQIKEVLENGLVVTKEPNLVAGGGRTTISTTKYCAGPVIANSNSNPQDISDAVMSRTEPCMVYAHFRKDRTTESISDLPDYKDKKTMDVVDIFSRIVCSVATVNFLMRSGILSDVTMTAFNIKVQQLQQSLKSRMMRTVDVRKVRRMYRVARKLVIIRALELRLNNTIYNRRGSYARRVMAKMEKPGLDGVLGQMMDIEPHLYCTEEIANVVIATMTRPNAGVLDKTLWRLAVKSTSRSHVSYEKDLDPRFVEICASLARRISTGKKAAAISAMFSSLHLGGASTSTSTRPGISYDQGAGAGAGAGEGERAWGRSALSHPPDVGVHPEGMDAAEEAEEMQRDASQREARDFEERMERAGLVREADGTWVYPDGADRVFYRSANRGHIYFHQAAEMASYVDKEGKPHRILAHPNYLVIRNVGTDDDLAQLLHGVVQGARHYDAKAGDDDQDSVNTTLELHQMRNAISEAVRSQTKVVPQSQHCFMRAVQILMDDQFTRLRVMEDGSCIGNNIPEEWKKPDPDLAKRLARYNSSEAPARPAGSSGGGGGGSSAHKYYWWNMSGSEPRFVRDVLSAADAAAADAAFRSSYGMEPQSIQSDGSAAKKLADMLRKAMSTDPIMVVRREESGGSGTLEIAIPYLEKLFVSQVLGCGDEMVSIIRENCVRGTTPMRVVVPRPEGRAVGFPQLPESFLIGPRDNKAKMQLESGDDTAFSYWDGEEGGDGEGGEDGEGEGEGEGGGGSGAGAGAGAPRAAGGVEDGFEDFEEDLASARKGPGGDADRDLDLGQIIKNEKHFVSMVGKGERCIISESTQAKTVTVEDIDRLAWRTHCVRIGLHPETEEAKTARNDVVLRRIGKVKMAMLTGAGKDKWTESTRRYPENWYTKYRSTVEGARVEVSIDGCMASRFSSTPVPTEQERMVANPRYRKRSATPMESGRDGRRASAKRGARLPFVPGMVRLADEAEEVETDRLAEAEPVSMYHIALEESKNVVRDGKSNIDADMIIDRIRRATTAHADGAAVQATVPDGRQGEEGEEEKEAEEGEEQEYDRIVGSGAGLAASAEEEEDEFGSLGGGSLEADGSGLPAY